MSRNYLSRDDELRRGDSLVSNNGDFRAVFQSDGNFVIYGWQPVWASDTFGSDVSRLVMQGDCNLVMYNKEGKPRWHTNSYRKDGKLCRLHLTDDGKLVVSGEEEELWNSSTSKGTTN